MKKYLLLFGLCSLFALFAMGCKAEDDNEETDSLTGVSISGKNRIAPSAKVTLTAVPVKTGNLEIAYEWSITEENSAISIEPSGATAKLSATADAVLDSVVKVKVTATWGSVTVSSEEKTVAVSDADMIKASDTPVGFAASGYTPITSNVTTVSSRAELISAVSNGGLIYINGMIDMTDGDYGTMLPTSEGGTTAGLDSFVNAKASAYSTYTAFKTAYAVACSKTTNDKSSSSSSQSGESTLRTTLWTLNKAYQGIVCLNLKSNTTIVGLTENSGIKGGSIQISGKSNVTLRNLIIQDAYDPFPHHEKNDGFNAELDGICIQGTTSNIWIDHCTIKDTMHCSTVTTSDGSEKWQTYDGLCDIKGSAASVTVSYCRLEGHDKTMLIGSDDTESVTGTRQVTLHHNYFLNCGQRLPMVRITNVHIYNNLYDTDSNKYYDQQYAIGVRSEAQIVAENNYFGRGIKYAFNGSSKTKEVGNSKENKVSATLLYKAGNSVKCTELGNSSYYTVVTSKPFTPSYDYDLDEASELPDLLADNAGAGVLTVVQ